MRFEVYLNESFTKKDNIIEVLKNDCKPFFKEIGFQIDLLYRGSNKKVNVIEKIKPRKNRQPKDTSDYVHERLDDMFRKKFDWYARSEGVFTTGAVNIAGDYGYDSFLFFPIGNFKFIWSKNVDDLFGYTEDYEYADEFSEDTLNYNETWNDEYGEESGNGVWLYKGNKSSSSDASDAIDEFFEEFKDDYDLPDEDDDDYEGVADEYKSDIESNMEWVPEMSEDEWYDEKETEWYEKSDSFYKELINKYNDRDLKKAIKSGNEIMFKCKEYYLVDKHYMVEIQNAIKNGQFK